MKKGFEVNQLDKTTLEFAIEKAWSFEFMCKKTKEGRTEARAYNRVQEILKYFLQEISETTK